MKKLFMAAMALFVAASTLNAAPPKNDEATAWKYAKKQAKSYAKEGWKVDGLYTLEESLYRLRLDMQRDPENNQTLIGEVLGTTNTKTVNQAKQWALNNAAVSYAKQAGNFLRLKINGENRSGINGPSLESFYESYEGLVQKNIQNELRMRFGMYKENGDKSIEYMAWFLINEENASRARLKAMETALKESEFAREHAKELSEFVREGFKLAE